MEYLKTLQQRLATHLSLPSAQGYSNVPTSYGATEGLQVLPSDATKIEPKVWLASERTFLNWLRVALLISSFALALFNGAETKDYVAKWMGAVYALLSVGILAYAYGMQRKRRDRIVKRYAGNHDELWGPLLICIAIFFAVLVNFVLRVEYRERLRHVKSPKNPWLRSAEVIAQGVGWELEL